MIIIPTIDVEGVHGSNPWQQLARGEIDDVSDWGALRIARLLKEFNVQGTFFVDIYEYSLWGEDVVGELCVELMSLGQDVQLHTHPGWRVDSRDSIDLQNLKLNKSFLAHNLDMMSKLTFNQQVEILERGIDFFEKWLDQRPVIHRSGGYSLNQDTLNALRYVGIPVDSSMNVAHTNSKVIWSSNQVIEHDNLLEIPVTVMSFEFKIKLFKKYNTFYSKLIKTDLNVFNIDELKHYCIDGNRFDVQIMNFFMHSYSLLSMNSDFSHIKPNRIAEQRLREFLGFCVSQNDLNILSCKQYYELWCSGGIKHVKSDVVPSIMSNSRIAGLGIRKTVNKFNEIALKYT